MRRYRCSGRVFPNGPAISRVGCDRRSPMTVQVAYGHAAGPYHPYEFQWLNLHWSGTPTTGLDPRANWNLDQGEYPGSGLVINCSITTTADPDNRFLLRVDFQSGFPVVHQWYDYGPYPFVHWEDFLSGGDLIYAGAGAPGPWILEDAVALRIGKYVDLPPDICIL